MKVYKEIWGVILEFDSIKDYVDFNIGRLYGYIILGILFYLIFLR
jgi:hypothetical protein